MKRQTKISITGGILGPLELADLKRIRTFIEDNRKEASDNLTEAALDRLHGFIEHKIEEATSIGRIV